MHRFIHGLARGTALVGGLVLIALIVLTTLSIIGRSLNKFLHSDRAEAWLGDMAQTLLNSGVGEINGSYEILEAGVAFAIFSFLPICQLYGGHATVDIFTSFLGARVNRIIAAIWEIVFAAALILISWRLYEGLLRYFNNGETTLFLQFPVWWGYAASFAACTVICIVAVYCAVMRVGEAVRNENYLPSEGSAH